jgi:hypothetical protein
VALKGRGFGSGALLRESLKEGRWIGSLEGRCLLRSLRGKGGYPLSPHMMSRIRAILIKSRAGTLTPTRSEARYQSQRAGAPQKTTDLAPTRRGYPAFHHDELRTSDSPDFPYGHLAADRGARS